MMNKIEEKHQLSPRQRALACSLVFLSVFFIYVVCCTPDLSLGDGGELTAAAWSLGSAHPPGYPGWCLATRAFTFLPFANAAHRAALGSAFFAALAVSILFLIFSNYCFHWAPALGAALLIAADRVFWSQAVIIEVYALNASLTVLLILLLFNWERSRDARYGYAAAFLFGLGLTNHQTLLVFLFSVIVLVVFEFFKRRIRFVPSKFLILFLFFLAGFSIYLFLPIRAARAPAMNWGIPDNAAAFVKHVTRSQYGGFYLRRMKQLLKTGPEFLTVVRNQFPFFLFLLPLYGFLVAPAQNRRMSHRFFTAFIILGPFYLLALTGLLFGEQLLEIDVYFIPSFICFAAGILVAFNRFTFYPDKIKKWALPLLSLWLAFGIGYNLVWGLQHVNESKNYLTPDYGKEMLRELNRNSAVYAQGDYEFFSAAYLQSIENYRTDVIVMDANVPEGPDIFGYVRDIPAGVTLYATNKLSSLGQYAYTPEMFSYHIDGPPSFDIGSFWEYLRSRLIQPHEKATDHYFEKMIWSNVFFFKAARLLYLGKQDGLKDALKGVEVSQDIPQTLNNFASMLAEHDFLDHAVAAWRQAVEIDPHYVKALNNLGIVMKKQGERIRSVEYWERSLLIEPGQIRVRNWIIKTLTQPTEELTE